MNERIYLHTINNGYNNYYVSKKQKEVLESILKSRKILSKRMQGYNEKNTTINFAGLDYISLSDYEKRFISNKEEAYYNCYYGYSRRGISFSFPHDSLEVIEPTIIGVCSKRYNDFLLMEKLGLDENRYSDLPDEVQVKDSIPLEKMNGIIFPTREFMCSKVFAKKNKMIVLLKQELEEIKNMLSEYNYETRMYDIDTLEEIDKIDDYILKL